MVVWDALDQTAGNFQLISTRIPASKGEWVSPVLLTDSQTRISTAMLQAGIRRAKGRVGEGPTGRGIFRLIELRGLNTLTRDFTPHGPQRDHNRNHTRAKGTT
jgi:hypothetical protein